MTSLHNLLTIKLTREEVLGSQVADAQTKDGEFVQTGGDLFREWQQAGQPLQLPVQPVSMPFGRVGLGPFSRWLLHPDEHDEHRNEERGHEKNIRGHSEPPEGRQTNILFWVIGSSNKLQW